MTRALVAIALSVTIALAACSDDTTTNLGVAGASCVSSPECKAPLQCLQNVCTAVGAAGDDADAAGGDAASSDTDNVYVPDVVPEIVTAYDVADWEFSEDTGPTDTRPPTETTVFEDCGELGVASSWRGNFIGAIDFNLAPNPLVPTEGTLPIDGVLEFGITCIESKFIVAGTLDGTATVVGQGDFPFTLELRGYYNPVEKTMTARMVDGVVTIYGFIEVYFEGDFPGAIQPNGNFIGTWDGESTGTNQALVTGTAEGEGVWGASPVP